MNKKWELTELCRDWHSISDPEMNQRLCEVLEILLSNEDQFKNLLFSDDFKNHVFVNPLVQPRTKKDDVL